MIYTFMIKVYLISSGVDDKIYKIGHTRRGVKNRIKEFKTGNSSNLEVVDTFESKWGTKIEASLHKRYKRIEGEWFKLDEKDILNFNDECKKLHDIFELLSTQNTWVIDKGYLS